MESKILEKIRLPIKQLDELQGNFKTLGKKQFEKLKGSIKKNGFIQPFFVWKNGHKNYILDGHQRKKAIIDLYGDTIDVDCLEIRAKSILEAKKLCIYYASSYAEFDKESFIDFADGLSFDDVEDFEFPGFKLNQDDFLNTEDNEADDEIPEVAQNEMGVQLGDIYTLGDHRLMCGDSVDVDCLKTLLGESKIDLVFTSPPYNQNLDSFKPSGMQKESPNFINKMGRSYFDSLPEEDYQIQQIQLLNMIYAVTSETASIFYNHKIRYRDKQIISPLDWVSKSQWKVRQEIIWDRAGSITLNARMFMPCDERIYWLTKDDFYFNDTTEIKSWSSVWRIAPKNEIKNVSAPFPNELPLRGILACSKPNQNVMDPYGGSGTTLIQCEKTKRKCYMMELDPHYCSVIIKRWEKFTGQKAVKCA